MGLLICYKLPTLFLWICPHMSMQGINELAALCPIRRTGYNYSTCTGLQQINQWADKAVYQMCDKTKFSVTNVTPWAMYIHVTFKLYGFTHKNSSDIHCLPHISQQWKTKSIYWYSCCVYIQSWNESHNSQKSDTCFWLHVLKMWLDSQ